MNKLTDLISSQRAYFLSGATRPLAFRQVQLKKLREAIKNREAGLTEALQKDLHKPTLEAFASEIAIVYEEMKFILKKLPGWVKPARRPTPLVHFPARSWVQSEPLGCVLVIAPWNYPFQLLISPLMGAIAAGNCVILKPSELAPHTSAFVANLIKDTFGPEFVACVEGGVDVNTALLEERFDYIFYTGGAPVAKIVATAAAKHLTPVTLELGGKSPALIDSSAPLRLTARRLIWGKFFNAGQTCVAPDYVLVPKDKQKALIEEMKLAVQDYFGADPHKSPDYARIINQRHFERLKQLIPPSPLDIGGETDAADKYIAPTVFSCDDWESPVMQEEIFGPLLPVLGYEDAEQALQFIESHPKPLALYIFSRNKRQQNNVLARLSFGGGCVNDTLVHLATPHLPFGGVGGSGYGSYHGRSSFECFSHFKPILKRGTWLDVPLRYPPYKNKLRWVKKLLTL